MKTSFLYHLSDTHFIKGTSDLVEVSLSTNSKDISNEKGLLCLKGENFDAFDFIESILDQAPPFIIFNYTDERREIVEKWATKYPQILMIGVLDSLLTLQELAEKHILDWKKLRPHNKVIGITGSNGKTTHKEMFFALITSILGDKVYCTQGNYNNHIGVPLTLLEASGHHEMMIIEMGSNHLGEIHRLCEIAHPDNGIITNIGDAHIEFFKNKENILKEKGDLYRWVKKETQGEGVFVINGKDSYLNTLESFPGLIKLDRQIEIAPDSVNIKLDGEKVTLSPRDIFGEHNFSNLAICYVLAVSLFPDEKEKILEEAKHLKLPNNNRSQWLTSKDKHYFLDAYNANPSSMITSLKGFIDKLEKLKTPFSDCLFILGDMNELGERAPDYHEEVGAWLLEKGAKEVAFIGRYSHFYKRGHDDYSKAYDSKDDFLKDWSDYQLSHKYFFIKGSRSLQLETLIDIN